MKTIELSREVNRWDELIAAYEAGETVELVDEGRPIARVEPGGRRKISWDPQNPNAIWEEFRRFRESLPKGGAPMAVQDIRELRES